MIFMATTKRKRGRPATGRAVVSNLRLGLSPEDRKMLGDLAAHQARSMANVLRMLIRDAHKKMQREVGS